MITILYGDAVNSSGYAKLSDRYSSWFDIVLHYWGHTYEFKRVDMHPGQTTYLTVALPSGNASVTYSPLVSSTSTASSWQVLKTNVTVSYDTQCMVLYAVGHGCPTMNANTNASSLRGVELVAYQGTDYYAGNFSEGPYGPGPYSNGRPVIAYHNVLFTNSTIFCVSPSYGDYVVCPYPEPLPIVSW
jgi:hypothetical protein